MRDPVPPPEVRRRRRRAVAQLGDIALAATALITDIAESDVAQIAQQRGAGVAGLLGVELGRAQRPVLDGGDGTRSRRARSRSRVAGGIRAWGRW